MEVYLHLLLTSTLDGGEWSASRSGAHSTGGWVDPRAGLDVVKSKYSIHACKELNPGRLVLSLVTILTELPRLLDRIHGCIFCLIEHDNANTGWGSGGIAPRVLNYGTRWRWVVSFTPRPIYRREKNPRYQMVTLGGSGCGGEEKRSHYCPGQELYPGRSARSLK
jgi:hypothetical protein